MIDYVDSMYVVALAFLLYPVASKSNAFDTLILNFFFLFCTADHSCLILGLILHIQCDARHDQTNEAAENRSIFDRLFELKGSEETM